MPDDSGKDPAAVALGKKGGKARAEALSAKKRNEIAKNEANAMSNLGKYIFIQYQPSSLGMDGSQSLGPAMYVRAHCRTRQKILPRVL